MEEVILKEHLKGDTTLKLISVPGDHALRYRVNVSQRKVHVDFFCDSAHSADNLFYFLSLGSVSLINMWCSERSE